MASYRPLPADCVSLVDVCKLVVARDMLPGGVQRQNRSAPFRLFASFLSGASDDTFVHIRLLKTRLRHALVAAQRLLGDHYPGSVLIQSDAHVALWVSVMSLTRLIIPFRDVHGFFERPLHQMIVQTRPFAALLAECGVSWPPVDVSTLAISPEDQADVDSRELRIAGIELVRYARISKPTPAPTQATLSPAILAIAGRAEAAAREAAILEVAARESADPEVPPVQEAPAAVVATRPEPARPSIRAPVAVRRPLPEAWFGTNSGSPVVGSPSTVGSSSESAFRALASAGAGDASRKRSADTIEPPAAPLEPERSVRPRVADSAPARPVVGIPASPAPAPGAVQAVPVPVQAVPVPVQAVPVAVQAVPVAVQAVPVAVLPAHMLIHVYPDRAIVPRHLFDQMYAAWMASLSTAGAAAGAATGAAPRAAAARPPPAGGG